MARACTISLLRKAVITLCVLSSLLHVRAATPGSSGDQAGNLETDESWKDYLIDRGITISLEWDADLFVNAHGGMKQGAETDGLISLSLDLDCQKITKFSFFDNTAIHVRGYYPYGADISDSYVGDFAGVNNNYAYNSPRLNELWVQKTFQVAMLDCSVRTGLLAADEEFDLNDTAGLFINSSFGAPLALAGNAPIPVYPFAALAVRLDFSVGDPSAIKVTFRTGVFDGNSAAPTLGPFAVGAPAEHSYNRYGVDFHLNPSTGLIFLNEFTFDFLKSAVPEIPAKEPGGWFFGPGHIVIGGFYASNQFENIYQAELQNLGALEPPAQVGHIAGNYGVYAIWEQKLYEDARSSPNGLFLFGRGLLLPDDRNFDICQPRWEPFTKEFFDGKKIRRIRLASGSPTITSATRCEMQTRLPDVRASREFRITNLSLSWKRPTSSRSLNSGRCNPICNGSFVRDLPVAIVTLWSSVYARF